jgi:hypothetical protein
MKTSYGYLYILQSNQKLLQTLQAMELDQIKNGALENYAFHFYISCSLGLDLDTCGVDIEVPFTSREAT